VDVNGVEVGDTHNWEVWHMNKPFEAYREHPSRFVSEFGFQSLPSLETIRTYAQQADWNMTSYIMEHHQRNEAGNRKIITYMSDHFRTPKDFSCLVYLTQILQAEAVRTGVEYWRRERARTSGALYWQLNDCWPVASWSSLDYYGRWKALHYAARRFFAPLLLSIEDEDAKLDIHLTSDMTEPWQGKVVWSLETLAGESLAAGQISANAKPLADTLVESLDFSEHLAALNPRQVLFVCQLLAGDEVLSISVVIFAPTKHIELVDPNLKADLRKEDEGLTVELQAESLARFVEVSLEGADVVFSDNYFDLPAGRRMTVHTTLPDGWTLEQARTALKLRSVFNSF
jgi:beta-mannosidase